MNPKIAAYLRRNGLDRDAAAAGEERKLRHMILSLTLACFAASWAFGHAEAAPDNHDREGASITECTEHGHWINARSGERVSSARLFTDLSQRPFVLLGETHDNPEHHRWQLHTLAGLHGLTEKLVIGFEMFPRSAQSALDEWVKGNLTAKSFLKKINWRKFWGFDPKLYMPLFNFARMHSIPMVALNVDRGLVSRVGAEGWNSVPENERQGLTDPAPASASYEQILASVYQSKRAMKAHDSELSGPTKTQKKTAADDESIADLMQEPGFKRFVAAQLTWDRAMAEGLVMAKRKHSDALIVGVMGTGHLSNFHGVPHQLGDLGKDGSAVLIPVDIKEACDKLGANYADFIFTVKPPAHPDRRRARLGVRLTDEIAAALVEHVIPNSVADAAKLRKGDRVIRAADLEISSSDALIEVIARQAPGTWLPLTVERDGKEIELIAKFPAQQKQEP